MRLTVPGRGLIRTVLPLAMWTGAVAAAFWLYRDGAGPADAVGVAQVKEYKVAPADVGRLASLEVVEGQQVARGQVVARMETDLIEKEILAAQARLRQSSSDVRATGVSLDVSRLQSERGFQSEIEATDIELGIARSGFASDRAELGKLLEDMDHQRDLVRRGLTRADRLRDMELRRAALEEAVKAWPQRIEAIEARRQSAAARLAGWRQTQSGTSAGESRQTQLQPLNERVREQQELLELLLARYRNATLRAASDGYVAAILARPGDVVRGGDPILTLVETRPRQVIGYLEERRGAVIRPGAAVLARRRSGAGESLPGKIVAVSGPVTQLPQRFWTAPQLPAWGREFYVELPEQAALDPGEAVDIVLVNQVPAPDRPLAAQARTRGGDRR